MVVTAMIEETVNSDITIPDGDLETLVESVVVRKNRRGVKGRRKSLAACRPCPAAEDAGNRLAGTPDRFCVPGSPQSDGRLFVILEPVDQELDPIRPRLAGWMKDVMDRAGRRHGLKVLDFGFLPALRFSEPMVESINSDK
jgi:hypothetical protein